ncbi:MAG: 2-amino-4-hydroxy-6-hydroxymethyldihydropteridine diphosphokinase [Candidatus Krumholzibacteriia bacterium]
MSAAEVALSLGSNLGDRRANLAAALRALDDELLEGMEVSGVYETAPVEVGEAQPAFWNCCAVGRATLAPADLLARTQRLEREAGRPPGGPRRPRVLDLDLLYYAHAVRSGPGLALPHPGLPRRRFVLAPLAELRPDWRHPADDRRVDRMLTDLGDAQPVRRLDCEEGWWRRDGDAR